MSGVVILCLDGGLLLVCLLLLLLLAAGASCRLHDVLVRKMTGRNACH